jgi:hypothetical protein
VIFLPAVLLVAQPQAWTAVISPTVSLSNLGVMALAAGCFASLASRRRSALAGAVLCAAAAPFCSANGILVAPVAAAVPWLRGERQRALVWTAAAVVFVAAYFALARSDYGASDPRASLGDPLALLHYGLNFVGAAGGFGHAGAAPAVGAALLALLGLAAARGGAARNPAHTAMVLFLLASIGANALLRAHQGADAPLHQPRYRAYAAVLLALAWLLAADTASARVRRRLVPVAIVASLAFWAASTWHGNRSARAAAAELEQGLEIWWETGAGGLRHPDYRKARFFLHAALDRGLLRLPDDWYERFATRPEPIDAATTPSPRRLSLEALREEAGTLLAIGEIQGRSPAGTGGLSLLLADEQGRTWRAPARAVAPTPPAAGARRSRTRSAATGFHALVDTSELAPGQYRVGLALESGERQSVAWSDASVTLAAHGARGYSGSR